MNLVSEARIRHSVMHESTDTHTHTHAVRWFVQPVILCSVDQLGGFGTDITYDVHIWGACKHGEYTAVQ